MPPFFVSSVNGNLVASLWTLQQGCMERLRQPVIQPCCWKDCWITCKELAEAGLFPRSGRPAGARKRGTADQLHAAVNRRITCWSKRSAEQRFESEAASAGHAEQQSMEQTARSYAP
jgi:hypothetical protein